MEIILLRHGEPDIRKDHYYLANEMPAWIADYNRAGVVYPPPTGFSLPAFQAGYIVSSPMPRAIDSLRLLGLQPLHIDSLFSEAELPTIALPKLRLRPTHWVTLFRLLWLCGYAKDVESFSFAKQRAKTAKEKLVSLATHQKPVVLLGHGIMNRLIAHELKQAGWKQHRHSGNGYWNVSIYRLRHEGERSSQGSSIR